MRILITSLFLFLFLAVSSGAVHGEGLTLKQAVTIALENNPLLKSYRWTVRAQEEDVYSAKGHLYPKLTIEETYRRTNNPVLSFMSKLNQQRFSQDDFLIDSLNNPDNISDFQTSLNLAQPIYAPGIYEGIRMAGGELDAVMADYEMKKEETALNVVKAFHLVQTVRAYVKTAKQGVEDAREHRRLASIRYDSGLGQYSDVLRAEVVVKEAMSAEVKAEGDLDVSQRALGLLLGRTGPVDVTEDKPLLILNDINVYLDASAQRDDLKAFRSRHENSLNAVNMEKSVFLPEIGMGGSYFLNDHRDPFSAEGESYLFMGYLKWNLFDASIYHRIKKAKAKVHEAEEHLTGLENEINFRVNESYTRVKVKEQHLSLKRAVLQEAEEAVRLVRLRYESSLAPMVDLLDTQTMLDTARAGLVEAENEYLNALADLHYQSGMLLKTLMQDRE